VSAIDYEAEYDNPARVPEHPQIILRWAEDSAQFRARHINSEIGIPYGASARTRIDIFWPDADLTAPIALFIHGGYWRALDPSSFSWLAPGCNGCGLACAVAGYDLCPTVTIDAIIGQMRAAAIFLFRQYGRRLVAYGHSAGGHLTACLVATDWKSIARDLPADLVPAGVSISGLFDLAPMVVTKRNADLRLDAESARRGSPLFWDVPPGRVLDAWVGGDESSEFHRQSRTVVDTWGRKGVVTRIAEVAGANHFTVLDPLTDPESAISVRLAELAKAAG
jgi:arylformamidase